MFLTNTWADSVQAVPHTLFEHSFGVCRWVWRRDKQWKGGRTKVVPWKAKDRRRGMKVEAWTNEERAESTQELPVRLRQGRLTWNHAPNAPQEIQWVSWGRDRAVWKYVRWGIWGSQLRGRLDSALREERGSRAYEALCSVLGVRLCFITMLSIYSSSWWVVWPGWMLRWIRLNEHQSR